MNRFQRSIEKQIKEAQEQGKFDDLPGKGKPLDLEVNPHEDPSWRMAYSLLENSGYSLPWIENGKAIDDEFLELKSALGRSWAWFHESQAAEPSIREEEWEKALKSFREKVEDLNNRIRLYNLEIPHLRFEKLRIDPEKEIKAVQEENS